MKTLVTGGSGFVGLNLVEVLLARGEAVVAVSESDFPDYARATFAALPGKLEIVRADVTDAPAVHALFAQHRPAHVVHAAVITAGEARELEAFDRVVDVNLKGTAHVLDAAVAHGARRVVYVSSGSAYGAALAGKDAVDEDTAPAPDSLYAITKYASERVCARWRVLRGLDVVCARVGSVFGPWERDTGVRDTLSLPFQILKLARSGAEIVLPAREPRRDWIYSRDVARALVALRDAASHAHTLYNLAAGREWPQFASGWCKALARVYPGLRWRVAGAHENPNVGFLGPRDRAIMSVQRLRESGFAWSRGAEEAFDDYVGWLAAHAACYD